MRTVIARGLAAGDHLVLEVTASTPDPLDDTRQLVVVRVPDGTGRSTHLSIDADTEVPTHG